jgi:SnoaL-like domain
MDELEMRIQRLEDRQAIQDLTVRYGFYVDDRRYDKLKALFAPDGCLRTNAGVLKGEGIDGVGAYFEHHLPELGPSNHFVHGHVIDFDDVDRDLATGLVAGHAELWRDGKPMITALRYHDKYTRTPFGWRFLERIQAYMYFVDVREYPETLGSRLRIRTSATPLPADWPRISS